MPSNWKIETAELVKEITNHNGNFIKAKALMETSEDEKGITVFGWIADYGTGHLFISHDSDRPLDTETHWFENIEPL